MRSPVAVVVAVGTVVALAPVSVRPAWVALPLAAERRQDGSAEAPLREPWEAERQAPAVQPAMGQLERAIPL